jgi:hypothetical protein
LRRRLQQYRRDHHQRLPAIGIRTRLRPLERAGFFKEYAEKKLKNVVQGSSGAYGTAATRIEGFVAAGGPYVYGSYPDIEGLVREQGRSSIGRSGSRRCIASSSCCTTRSSMRRSGSWPC